MGVYNSSNEFLSGAVKQVKFTFKRLGGDVLDIELTEQNVYANYEEAVLEYSYIVNTTEGRQAITDSVYIRREALLNKVTYTTTMNAAFATVQAKSADDRGKVTSVQELHARING